MKSRREFFKAAVMGSTAIYLPHILSAAIPVSAKGKILLRQDDVILFQGDSITDAGRHKNEKDPNNSLALGAGYCTLACGQLLKNNTDKNLKVYNRGVSGDKVYQLKERWQTDCIALRPTVLSIHIGVNDYWHTLTANYNGTAPVFEQSYRALLHETKLALPDVRLIIGEPFAMLGVRAVKENWFPEFDLYREISQRLATEFDAIFIPYHSLFVQALQFAPASYWTTDGVHPTLAGSQLMAEAWLSVIG